jgi:hypothetical protein
MLQISYKESPLFGGDFSTTAKIISPPVLDDTIGERTYRLRAI